MSLWCALLRISDCPEKVIDLAITECHSCTNLDAMSIILENQDIVACSPQMHAYAEAVACLERYLAIMPHADDNARVREQIAWLRAWFQQN